MLLSIITTGKNDNYRENNSKVLKLNLETTIKNLKSFDLDDVELILCDWGSESKIVEEITTEKYKTFKCVYVPPNIAEKYNKGWSYSYVHPHNTASRYATGEYIIFWDSDTVLRKEDFKKLYDFVSNLNKDNSDTCFYWASRKEIGYENYKDLETAEELEQYIETSEPIPKSHNMFYLSGNSFGGTAVALLMNRKMWIDCTGWWEELIYWGWADIEIHNRLLKKYSYGGDLCDFGIDFYHLSYPLDLQRPGKANSSINSKEFKCNPPNWGLKDEKLIII